MEGCRSRRGWIDPGGGGRILPDLSPEQGGSREPATNSMAAAARSTAGERREVRKIAGEGEGRSGDLGSDGEGRGAAEARSDEATAGTRRGGARARVSSSQERARGGFGPRWACAGRARARAGRGEVGK